MANLSRIGMKVETVCVLELNDAEVEALDALAGYGVDSFLKVFYEKLGRAYMEPHEAGLRSLFKAVQGCDHLVKAAHECREFLGLVAEERNAVIQQSRSKRRLSRIA